MKIKGNHFSRRAHQVREVIQGRVVVFLFVMLLCLASLVTGCQSNPPDFSDQTSADSLAPVAGSLTNPAARLHEGDVLRINFEGDTNLNSVVKIQLDGNINLQLIGDVKAAGKSLPELQADLMERYKPQLKVPELSINLVSTSAIVYVSGAVLRPGRIAMDRPLTALDAIMEAGGFDYNRAKSSSVIVLRTESGRQKHFKLDLKKALNGEDPAPFLLKPFDIVHVPEKTFRF